MADNQDPSIGWGGTAKLATELGVLTELANVVSFKPPADKPAREDATHLKSPGRRKQTIPGLYDSEEISLVIHHRPASDTYGLIIGAKTAGTVRQLELGIPANGVVVETHTFDCKVTGYEINEVQAGSVMTATVMVEIAGDVVVEAVL